MPGGAPGALSFGASGDLPVFFPPLFPPAACRFGSSFRVTEGKCERMRRMYAYEERADGFGASQVLDRMLRLT